MILLLDYDVAVSLGEQADNALGSIDDDGEKVENIAAEHAGVQRLRAEAGCELPFEGDPGSVLTLKSECRFDNGRAGLTSYAG